MSDTVLTTLIKTTPGLLWVIFAAVVFFVLRRPLVEQLARLRAASTPFGNFDFDVTLNLVEQVAENRAGPAGDEQTSPLERRAVVTRLEHAADLLVGGRILWVDDDPAGNASLVDVFEQVGMVVRLAESTDSGLGLIRRDRFDLAITDMARPGDPVAGFEFAERVGIEQAELPVIVFAGSFDPRQGVHPNVFAHSTAYDDLIHLVIDVMERVRFGAFDVVPPATRPPRPTVMATHRHDGRG